MATYRGTHQLWLHPGAEVQEGAIEATLDDDVLSWRWTLAADTHEGSLNLTAATFEDTFHQSDGHALEPDGTFGARFAGTYAYGEADAPWSWRIVVADRPSGELVVQMFNITPWGEGMLAVQWVLTPA